MNEGPCGSNSETLTERSGSLAMYVRLSCSKPLYFYVSAPFNLYGALILYIRYYRINRPTGMLASPRSVYYRFGI